jgi:hypothetical protein
MDFRGVGVWWGVVWLELTRGGVSLTFDTTYAYTIAPRQLCIMQYLDDRRDLSTPCLHGDKNKNGPEGICPQTRMDSACTGGASLIRTGDLRIMIPSL